MPLITNPKALWPRIICIQHHLFERIYPSTSLDSWQDSVIFSQLLCSTDMALKSAPNNTAMRKLLANLELTASMEDGHSCTAPCATEASIKPPGRNHDSIQCLHCIALERLCEFKNSHFLDARVLRITGDKRGLLECMFDSLSVFNKLRAILAIDAKPNSPREWVIFVPRTQIGRPYVKALLKDFVEFIVTWPQGECKFWSSFRGLFNPTKECR